jgi:hypothetical protein
MRSINYHCPQFARLSFCRISECRFARVRKGPSCHIVKQSPHNSIVESDLRKLQFFRKGADKPSNHETDRRESEILGGLCIPGTGSQEMLCASIGKIPLSRKLGWQFAEMQWSSKPFHLFPDRIIANLGVESMTAI